MVWQESSTSYCSMFTDGRLIWDSYNTSNLIFKKHLFRTPTPTEKSCSSTAKCSRSVRSVSGLPRQNIPRVSHAQYSCRTHSSIIAIIGCQSVSFPPPAGRPVPTTGSAVQDGGHVGPVTDRRSEEFDKLIRLGDARMRGYRHYLI